MSEIEETVFAFDAATDFEGIQNYFLGSKEPPHVFAGAVWSLLDKQRVRSAYLISKLLHIKGAVNPIMALAIYLGATDVGNTEDAELGRHILRHLFNRQSPQDQELTRRALEPFILNELSAALAEPDLSPRMLRLLSILKEIVPEFRTLFDLTAPAPPFDVKALSEAGRARAKLVPVSLPPAGTPRRRRRAIVAIRELFFPQFKNSRVFESGPTIVAAMKAYGWNASFVGMKFDKQEENDCRVIVETCIREKAEVLVLDAVILHFPAYLHILADLRVQMPNLKIVGYYFDAWPIKTAQLKRDSILLDLVWTINPGLDAWNEPELVGKVFAAPFPRGGDYGGPILPLLPKMTFIGGVAGYNWHRAIWIAAMRSERLPVESHMTEFTHDGLTPVESYLLYMRRLADSRCSLNFSMRGNMAFIVTGRTFEVLSAGALLVQERCPEMDCYFIEGEHYLPFTTFADLRSVAKFIQDNPEEAEDIRRKGNAFFRERYIDDKLMAYLDQRLFSPM